MSGGHYNYLFYQIEDTYKGEMEYLILEKLLVDFCKLLKELEWYRSDDTTKAAYDKVAKEFIAKWLKSSRAKDLNKKGEIIGRFEDLIKDLKKEANNGNNGN